MVAKSNKNPAGPGVKYRQTGFLMTGALIAVVVAGAMAALLAERVSHELRAARAVQLGQSVAQYGEALQTYIVRNYSALSQGRAVVDVASARHITAEELIRHLSLRGVSPSVPGLPTSAAFKFVISVPDASPTGEACAPNRAAHPGCRISGVTYVDQPIGRGGAVDMLGAALAARAIGEFGGHTTRANPSMPSFKGRSQESLPPLPNLGINKPGIVARLVDPFYRPEIASDFLRTNGGNTMVGQLRMQNDVDGTHHDIVGVGQLRAREVESTNGYIWAGSSRGGRDHGAWLSASGEIVSAGGNIVARQGSIWAHQGDVFANSIRFNSPGQNAHEGVVARLDEACGDSFVIAPGPAPYYFGDRDPAGARLPQEHLYICTHDVYFSGPEIKVSNGGRLVGSTHGMRNSDGYAPTSPYPLNLDNPGYYRSRHRVWRPIDQKSAVTQRFQLQDEGATTVDLGFWQICSDSTGLLTQYKSSYEGYFMPIVLMLYQDATTGKWAARYERYSNYIRNQGYWGKIVCRGKL